MMKKEIENTDRQKAVKTIIRGVIALAATSGEIKTLNMKAITNVRRAVAGASRTFD